MNSWNTLRKPEAMQGVLGIRSGNLKRCKEFMEYVQDT
jgi:hypothetical protein